MWLHASVRWRARCSPNRKKRDGSTLDPQQFLRALIGFSVARADFVRGMSLGAISSEREVVKASFQLGADAQIPTGKYTEALAVISALTSTATSKFGPEPESLKRWVLYHAAWLNACVVGGIASNDETSMRAMRAACAKNQALLMEVSADLGLSPKAMVFDKSEQLLSLVSTEAAEGCELHDLVQLGERCVKVAGASFRQEASNLTPLFDGNPDHFRASNRGLMRQQHCLQMQVWRTSSGVRIRRR